MMDKAAVTAWLDQYVKAWKSYDPQAIGNLFSQDANYYYGPYQSPLQGREAIVASWLENPDASGTYDASYEPVAVDGSAAVANGRSYYFEADGSTPRAEFDNIFIMRFDNEGRCAEFREWFVQKPKN